MPLMNPFSVALNFTPTSIACPWSLSSGLMGTVPEGNIKHGQTSGPIVTLNAWPGVSLLPVSSIPLTLTTILPCVWGVQVYVQVTVASGALIVAGRQLNPPSVDTSTEPT